MNSSPHAPHVARVGAGGAICAIALGASALIAVAHDDDPQKLADQKPPVVGPKATAANGLNVELAGGFPSENMFMHAWVPLNQMPGGQGQGNDCWGYVSPEGREYAIIGVEKGYVFFDVTDPGDPVEVGYVQGPSSTWHDVKVMGEYAYGVSEAGAGIQVMDLTQIDSGVVTHVGNVTDQGHFTTHNIVANPDSGYLYLAGANIANGGLVAVSVGDPESPQIMGGWTNTYVHDAQVVTYTEGEYAGREIAFCCVGGAGLAIVDVTDKDNMFTIGQLQYPGTAYGHQGWLNADRSLFYINDEADENNGLVPSTTTRVIDVTDLENPTHVSSFTNGADSIDHNLYIRDGYIFESNYSNGLRVFDANADPFSPPEVAYFDSYPQNDFTSFNGTWSNYPLLPSGIIILNDRESGMFILELQGVGCDVDFNGDGELDILDFVAFQNAFVGGSDQADFDGDGNLTILDFVAFQNAFNAGCA